MNPIESVTRALGCVLHTPQAEFYLGVGFPWFKGTPPTPREKAYFLRTVRTTTDTIQAYRQPVRDICGRLFVQGSPATPDIIHLVSKLSRMARVCHQAGNEWPDTMDEQGRKRTLTEWGTAGDYFTGWVHMIQEYFPQLVVSTIPSTDTTDQVADPGPAVVKVATIRVDRERLAGLFIPVFKEPRPRPGMEPLPPGFDMFYNALMSGAGNFTPTDIGRIAFQVRESKHVLRQFRNMPFAKFARLFYEICGVNTPKDLAPRTYRKQTTATRFECWLE